MSKVLLLGASGLIGGELLSLLLADARVSALYAPTRSPLAPAAKLSNPQHPDLAVALAMLSEPLDIVFCCLGTTRKAAGSRQAFRHVDYTLVVESALAARRLGAQHLLVVSALGASPRSLFFYSRVKGEMEQALRAQAWPHLTLARPSLLLGVRRTPRPMESGSACLFRHLPGKWRAIDGEDVAHALLSQAFSRNLPAVQVLEADRLRQLAAG
ncbi:NAD(P)H-binding protein [Affinibrenneria salicis]|uniref:NAD(P)H-binding protein n=1 Tax=Affinibrenneria salicis TaxID=2590031 RepID=A0A5J5FZ58_9GAMM|nr:NAD(P)H-binding protein [Affinibrenneria salicis]KAA8999303.1 NAD(P)H-binding protein [Affinibrenneria salicis]